MIPNFLVIGAARAGTTYIYENISLHPEIFVSEPKELHFFDRHYEKGITYYQKYFTKSPGYKAIGEATPAYLHEEMVAGRIREHLPGIKFIICLRNPVDRLYSRFWNAKAKFASNKGLSFEEKIRLKPEFINEGNYDEHINRYFKLFPRENFLILFFEEMLTDPSGFLRRIYQFLKVDESFVSPVMKKNVNAASSKKYLSKNIYLYYLQKLTSTIGLKELSEKLANRNRITIPKMLPETRNWLTTEIYFEHNRNLERILDIDLSHWNS